MLLRGLARLLESGLPPDRALGILAESTTDDVSTVIDHVRKRLAAGATLAQCVALVGLVDTAEAAIVAAAEQSGNLEEVLNRLATSSERRSALQRAVTARLALPAAVLVLAALLTPLPGLVAQRFGVAGYLLRAGGVLALPAGLAAALLQPRMRARLAHAAARLTLPPFAGWHRDYVRRNYLETLALSLRAGLPALEAIELAATTLPAHVRNGRAGSVKRHVMNGASVADALRGAGILSARGLALAQAGEAAGKLDDMLHRQVETLTDTIGNRETDIATWAPRIAYLLAAGVAVTTLL